MTRRLLVLLRRARRDEAALLRALGVGLGVGCWLSWLALTAPPPAPPPMDAPNVCVLVEAR